MRQIHPSPKGNRHRDRASHPSEFFNSHLRYSGRYAGASMPSTALDSPRKETGCNLSGFLCRQSPFRKYENSDLPLALLCSARENEQMRRQFLGHLHLVESKLFPAAISCLILENKLARQACDVPSVASPPPRTLTRSELGLDGRREPDSPMATFAFHYG
jgi:hypothetical protein